MTATGKGVVWPEEFMGCPVDETTVFEAGLRLHDPLPGRVGAIRDADALIYDDDAFTRRLALVWDRREVEGLVAGFVEGVRRGVRVGDACVLAAFYVASLVEPGVDVEALEWVVFDHRPHVPVVLE